MNSDDKTMIIVLSVFLLGMVVMLASGEYLDYKKIEACVKYGGEWKDGNCIKGGK